MVTLLQLQLSKSTKSILPTWILRLVGLSSVAIVIVNIAILFCRRFPPTTCQFIKETATTTASSSKTILLNSTFKSPNSSLASMQNDKAGPYVRTTSTVKRLMTQLMSYAMVVVLSFREKKKLTISLKNTILWNPSQDIAVANHAFNEYTIPLLSRLCQQYDVYLLIHTNNDNEKDQIHRLLAPIIIGAPETTKPATSLLDKSHIIYCQDEATKIRIIQYVLCPAVHVEGGCEWNDGEDTIRSLHPVVGKIVWVMTRRRRASFNKDTIKPKDLDILTDGLELTDSLLDSSLAREAGFFID